MIEELLERAVHFVEDPAGAPEVVEGLALGLERGGAVLVPGAAPAASANPARSASEMFLATGPASSPSSETVT